MKILSIPTLALSAASLLIASMGMTGSDASGSRGMVTMANAETVANATLPTLFDVCDARYAGGFDRHMYFTDPDYRNGITGQGCYLTDPMFMYLFRRDRNRVIADVTKDFIIQFSHLIHRRDDGFIAVQGITEDINMATYSQTWGKMLIDIRNNVFQGNGENRREQRGSAFVFRGQLTPGSVVNIIGNKFESYSRHASYDWIQGPYRWTCSALDFGPIYIPREVTVVIAENDVPKFDCYHQNWRYYNGRENAAIMVGVDYNQTIIDHDSSVLVMNNTAHNLFVYDYRNRPTTIVSNSIFLRNLKMKTGSQVLVHDNYLTGTVGKRINLEKFLFARREDPTDDRPAALLSIKGNYMATTRPHLAAVVMHPSSKEFLTAVGQFKINGTEGGTFLFEGNTLHNYSEPVLVQFPDNTEYTPTHPLQIRISSNYFTGPFVKTPISLIETSSQVNGSYFVANHNVFQMNDINVTTLLKMDGFTALNSNINLAGNVGYVAPGSKATSKMGKLIEIAAYSDLNEGISDLTFCNNTFADRVIEANDKLSFSDAENVQAAYCYRCKCQERGPAGNSAFCPSRPYCCSISSTSSLNTKCLNFSSTRTVYPSLV